MSNEDELRLPRNPLAAVPTGVLIEELVHRVPAILIVYEEARGDDMSEIVARFSGGWSIVKGMAWRFLYEFEPPVREAGE
jgi:hypothetical protein